MFSKIYHTKYPPVEKPMMVYDGKCGFCKYWVIKWMKLSRQSVDYRPFQEVASQFEDIPEQYFREAVRYIAINGDVVSGPDAAYITYFNQGRLCFLHSWYLKKTWFRILSDSVYQWIADHRNFMSRVSIWMFGKNPANPKGYWKWYLSILIVLMFSLVYYL